MNETGNESIDAVELMRTLRDRIEEETERMSVGEEIEWLGSARHADPRLARLAARVVEQRRGGDRGRKRA